MQNAPKICKKHPDVSSSFVYSNSAELEALIIPFGTSYYKMHFFISILIIHICATDSVEESVENCPFLVFL